MVERDRPADADPLAWIRAQTPVLQSLAEDSAERSPLDGLTVAVASHLEPKTGVFVETLHEAGADVLFTGSNPHSVHGDVVAHLDDLDGVRGFAWEGMDHDDLDIAQHELLAAGPDVVCSDGAELLVKAHAEHPEVADDLLGAAEQTTSGVSRVEAMDADGALSVPVYRVNHTPVKHWFDNVHGTGESALANVMLSTNTVLSGSTVVVAGYGYVGRGIAQKARGIGARTVVTEVDPRKALQAHMHGHEVRPMAEAASEGDLFVTATGNCHVIREEHFDRMQDGTVLCNVGHRNVEIAIDDLRSMSVDRAEMGDGITCFELPDGRVVNLLADGELVNLAGPFSQGHPAGVMDTTFGAMFATVRHLATADEVPAPGAYDVPTRIDREVASRKLDALGVDVDEMTDLQEEYLASWDRESVV
ncbi:adenosylhomocysteinase [Halobacterium litoreum]|uniref:Adenosylhomocysteinase n=1 Tax=Halobacterium litoreum TaxID=2039234 RepID=A0ABD5ND99_9EURY|nr:adenosylhomocysteinase [Halobacterium litoreum]UHH13817.1 adenosylhomocysteinase [Halobacterium litoreum]